MIVGVSLIYAALALLYALPRSAFRQAIPSAAWNLGSGLGLQQSWGVFAPNPPARQIVARAVVSGTEKQWTFDVGRSKSVFRAASVVPWIRWREEALRRPNCQMWPAFANFLIDESSSEIDEPKYVEVFLGFRELGSTVETATLPVFRYTVSNGRFEINPSFVSTTDYFVKTLDGTDSDANRRLALQMCYDDIQSAIGATAAAGSLPGR